MTEAVTTPPITPAVIRPCPVCSREWGQGVACRNCKQVQGLPAGVRLSSAGRRFGAYCLDLLLMVVTLWIGWIVWSLIVWTRGQTPAKQLLKMRTVDLRDSRAAGWGRMFLREILAKFVVGLLAYVTLGIVYFWLLWDDDKQELWDKMVNTIVVDDPQGLLTPGGGTPQTNAMGLEVGPEHPGSLAPGS